MGNMRVSLVGALAAVAMARPNTLQYRNTTTVDGVAHLMDAEPGLPHDDDASPYCTWWLDNTGGEVCADVPEWWGITMADFLRWNPSIKADCSGFVAGKSYCVEAAGEPPVTTTTQPPIVTPTSTTTTSTSTTTTAPPGGIQTPSPAQPGMVANCDAFHLIVDGDTCPAITTKYGISLDQLVEWNPEIGAECRNIWKGYYLCVSLVGLEPTPTGGTPTTPTNGIATPSPTQPGMVDNCDAFHLVVDGDTCPTIISKYGISIEQFTQWNSEAGSDCRNLWKSAYACVSVIGHDPKPPNGIETPTPAQPGMVDNCDVFHKVASGDGCASITAKYGISLDQFREWNTQAGANCNIWLDNYVCVSVIGHEGTPTVPPNGIETPLPFQDGMTGNCDTFHFVLNGESCDSIAVLAGVSTPTFVSWNPAVGSDCRNLWVNTYCCIGLI